MEEAMRIELQRRGKDAWGEGHYGASRGDRKHHGEDFLIAKGQVITAPIGGHVTKLGTCYSDDPSYRYVQITNKGVDYRFFYVEPMVNVDSIIQRGDVIGKAQNLNKRYKGMPNHIHFEVIVGGKKVDPNPYLAMMA